ncbi:DNA-processing protein DprA [Thermodesulfovibrio hydrogeniphilus]
MVEEKRFALALKEIDEIGPISVKRLLAKFGSFSSIFNAELEEIAEVEGIGINKAKKIKSFENWRKIDKLIQECEKREIEIFTSIDENYPKFLKEIHDPPIVLFCKGELREEDNYGIAIVGSRKLTEYGRRVTEKFSSELSAIGITIVSGLARGIDSVAHQSCLNSDGRTIAVLGSGVSNIYPSENKMLANRIVKNGAILSEYYPDESPKKENFPRRNRIISGMSIGTLVTEASINSGALITASLAIEQGKEVFAVPGNITSKNSEGTNLLIKKGAKIVTSLEDILEEIIAFIPSLKESLESGSNLNKNSLEGEEKLIFEILDEPSSLDELVVKTGINVSKLLEMLLKLEIEGHIIKIEGRYVRRK